MEEMARTEKQLRFQLFGRFAAFYGDKELKLDKSGTSNMIQLLSMLVFYREGLSRDELLRNLYGDRPLADRNNNLRVTLFKLRKMLIKAGLPEGSYVTLSSDVYRWSPDIPTTCDVWDFQRLVREAGQAQDARDEERELALRREACGLYAGELLPSIAGEEWVAVEDVPLKDKYTVCLKRLCELLERRQRYQEIVDLCGAAESFYPFDEWQIYTIDALIAMDQYDEALSRYQRFTERYYNELGIVPTVEMLTRYQKICSAMQYRCSSVDEIYWGLVEKQPGLDGAVYVSYPSFIDRFRFLQRISERSGESNYMVVATIQNKSGKPLEENGTDSALDEKVRDVIRCSLRRTDTFTKFNASQYLMLLVGIDMESIEIVGKRINKALAVSGGGLKMVCRHRALPMWEPERDARQMGWDFARSAQRGAKNDG